MQLSTNVLLHVHQQPPARNYPTTTDPASNPTQARQYQQLTQATTPSLQADPAEAHQIVKRACLQRGSLPGYAGVR